MYRQCLVALTVIKSQMVQCASQKLEKEGVQLLSPTGLGGISIQKGNLILTEIKRG